MKKKFVCLNYVNMNEMYRKQKLIKGCLVRYRFSYDTITTYGLAPEGNDWSVGIISEISWYHIPQLSAYGIVNLGEEIKERICYDIKVHNVTDGGGLEVINLETNEIYLLSE